ncbi:MAG: hypothetical protein ABJN36_06495 [Cyclobacteriaceae bacterium]|uniref:hypothetical protein n=1 Tax=Nonlabens ulvanivorans TaxID=906888 RepID=UPI00327F1DAE
MSKLYRYIWALGFFIPISVFAQESASGEIEDVQVIIEKDKPLTLPKAGRLHQKAEVKRIEEDTISLDYAVGQPEFSFETYKPSFEPKAFARKKTANLIFNNYVKVGYGNYKSPLIEAYGSFTERLNYVGAGFRHESFGRGAVSNTDSQFSSNELFVGGRYVARYVAIEPVVNYHREGFYYYGYDVAAFQAVSTPEHTYIQDRSLYNNFTLGGSITSTSNTEWQWSFTPVYSRATMAFKSADRFNTDQSIDLDADIGYALTENTGIDFKAAYTFLQYTSGSIESNRSKAVINPTYRTTADNFSLKVGVKAVFGSDTTSSFYFYPDLEARYNINDKLEAMLIIDGNLQTNSLSDVFAQNKYLNDSLVLINTNRQLGIKGGMNFRVSEKFFLEATAGYDVIKGQPLYYYSANDSSRFDVRYDDNFGRFLLSVKGLYMLSANSFISSTLNYYVYKEGSQAEAWFLPLRKLEIKAGHEFIKGLDANARLTVLGGIKAPLAIQPAVDQQEYINQDPIFDLGMDISYEIKENLEVFGQADNILNQKYERYMNYVSFGTTAKMGFIFRF